MFEGWWQGEHLETQMGNTGLNKELISCCEDYGAWGPYSICHFSWDSVESAVLFQGESIGLTSLLGTMFRLKTALENTLSVAKARRQVAAPAHLLWGRGLGT